MLTEGVFPANLGLLDGLLCVWAIGVCTKEIPQGPNILTLAGRIAGWEHIEAAAQAMEQAAATLGARAKDATIIVS